MDLAGVKDKLQNQGYSGVCACGAMSVEFIAVYTPLQFHWTKWLTCAILLGLVYVSFPLRPAPFSDSPGGLKAQHITTKYIPSMS